MPQGVGYPPRQSSVSPSRISRMDLGRMVQREREEEERERRRRLLGERPEVDIVEPRGGRETLDVTPELIANTAGSKGMVPVHDGFAASSGYERGGFPNVEIATPTGRERFSPDFTPPDMPVQPGLDPTRQPISGDPTMLQRLYGLATGGPTAHFTRNVAIPALGAAELAGRLTRDVPTAMAMEGAGSIANYFLGPGSSRGLGIDAGVEAIQDRIVAPTVASGMIGPVERNIREGRRLRGLDQSPAETSPATPVVETAADNPALEFMGEDGMEVAGPEGADEPLVIEPRFNQPEPQFNKQGDDLEGLEEYSAGTAPQLQQQQPPMEELRQSAQVASPTEDAGEIMGKAAEIVQLPNLGRGVTVQELYRAEDDMGMDIDLPTAMAGGTRPQVAAPLAPEQMDRSQAYAAITAAYGKRAADQAMDDPGYARRLLRGAVNAIERDPSRRQRYDDVLTGGAKALHRDPGFVASQEQQSPPVVSFGGRTGADAQTASADYEAFSRDYGPEAAQQASYFARQENIPISQLKERMDEARAAGREPSMLDFARTTGTPRPDGSPRADRFDISDLPDPRASISFGGRDETTPLYEGQSPAGRMAVDGGEPMDIYFPDRTSRGIEDVRSRAKIDNEAMKIELENRFGPGVTRQDVEVMTREEATNQAELGSKRLNDEISKDMQLSRGAGDDEFAKMLERVSATGEPEQQRRTWAEWWAGKAAPDTPAPKIEGAPEDETLEQRVQARLDAQAIVASVGGRVAGVNEVEQYLRFTYGAPPFGSREYTAWARQNPDGDGRVKSAVFHAQRLGMATNKPVMVR
jgi:hypothetical protein